MDDADFFLEYFDLLLAYDPEHSFLVPVALFLEFLGMRTTQKITLGHPYHPLNPHIVIRDDPDTPGKL